jgi:hypothetical protein
MSTEKAGGRFLERLTSEERKQYPMSSGLIDYFPDFLALISHVSWTGNEKHNPGQPLHWSRWNSTDHSDCVIRHHTTRDKPEHDVPLMHMAEEAWRVLAMGQEAMEKLYALDTPPGARDEPLDATPKYEFRAMDGPVTVTLDREEDEYLVQWTDISDPGIARIVSTDGPFYTHEEACEYVRENPNQRPGTASICVLSRV